LHNCAYTVSASRLIVRVEGIVARQIDQVFASSPITSKSVRRLCRRERPRVMLCMSSCAGRCARTRRRRHVACCIRSRAGLASKMSNLTAAGRAADVRRAIRDGFPAKTKTFGARRVRSTFARSGSPWRRRCARVVGRDRLQGQRGCRRQPVARTRRRCTEPGCPCDPCPSGVV